MPETPETTPCHDKTDFFFSPVKADQTLARAICRGCAFRSPCLAKALKQGEPDGIWGGLSPEERRRLTKALEKKSRSLFQVVSRIGSSGR